MTRLAACVEQAKRETHGDHPGAQQQEGESLRARMERWTRADVGRSGNGTQRADSSGAQWRELSAAAKRAASALQGRALLRGEAHALLEGAADIGGALQLAQLHGWLRLSGAVAAGGGGRLRQRRKGGARCLRCGSGEAHMHRTRCASCGRMCAYCSACLGMGRSRECELLILGMPSLLGGAAPAPPPTEAAFARWGLSPAQAAATKTALRFVELTLHSASAGTRQGESPPSFLLWAVTGAGKTEMIFPLVDSVTRLGGQVLIATPRRDVVLELDPRIRKAFPEAKVVTLYGGSEQRWERGGITLATTHQLMRFHQSFNLVIIDELDAFPYVNDPVLHYAAERCCSPVAARMFLSATPPRELQRQARKGRLPHARVPARYHRQPLPVPSLLRTPTVKQMLAMKRIPAALQTAMLKSLNRGAQLFVFVQRIEQTEPMAALLRSILKQPAIEGTSSKDPQRADKIIRFRNKELRVLVTTTILERGVTIPRSDVYILDADGRLFDEASLVQMAGRAGRSADDPNGFVYFGGKERTRSQVAAVRHIQKMNRIARSNGYLEQ
ncbi:DNA/RNA helicase [Paenibacillus radicis (ex Gao et al. 2016)]|uniref:DNA/RNA helicase n=2 Tax=Paenibacillus radicis (ex Gao et al. 2016) TaxID=1737354 RepID=A0A917HMX4_9BACL|nr:DNA/RNA helicase [Paenibacillus radicis (ex Gao et al. 2016)]